MSDHPTSEQLSRLIDADLPLTERAAVLDHLATCPTCSSSHARLVEAAAALRELPAVAWRPELAVSVADAATAAPPRAGVRRRRPFAAAAMVALAVALVLAVLAALPVALVSAHVVAAVVTAVAPLGAGSAGRLLRTLIGIALIAPVLLYPLARWR